MCCSHCESAEVRRGIRRGCLSAIMKVIGLWPYWCRSCGCIFYARGRSLPARICPLPDLVRERMSVLYWMGAVGRPISH